MKKNVWISIAICAMVIVTAMPMALANGSQPVNDGNEAEYSNGATSVTTSVNVAGGGDPNNGNEPPIVKCKWEYDLTEDPYGCEGVVPEGTYVHDADPNTPGLQVAPVLEGSVRIGFYAVVTDEQGVGTISAVYADVWHPDKTYKYEIELHPVGLCDDHYDKTIALAIWDHVISEHPDLLTYYDGYDAAEIREEINQEEAYIYYGDAYISYCQPGGWYYVGVRAVDTYGAWCDYLYNKFWYIPTAAIRVDFDSIDYGTVILSSVDWVGGDQDMDTPEKPTVRNIGNTPVELYVWQDDMGLGKSNEGQPDQYWNVEYDARLGADGEVVVYEPEETDDGKLGVRIPGVLPLCTTEKLDFSIHVKKALPGIDYTGTMKLYAYISGTPPWTTPGDYRGNAPSFVPEIYEGPYP